MEQVDELMAIVQRAKQKLLETPSNLPFQMPVANFSEPPPVQEPISLPKEIEQPVVIAPLDIPAVNFSGKLNSKPTSTTPMPSMPSMNYMLSNNALLGKGPPTLPTMPDAVSSICNRHNIGLADIGMAPKAPIKKMTKKKAEAPLPISKPTVPVLPTKKPVAQIKSLSKEPTPKVPPAIKGSKSQPVLGKPNSSNNGEGDNLMKVSIPTTVKNLRYSGSTSAIVSHEKENESFETASRPMTGDSHDSADGSRPNSNGSNRIRGKITQYQDYEDKLQQDYLQLKEKFNQKLQLQVQQSQKGGSNNQAVIDDDPMRKSLTEHYANASESIAMNENKKNFVPPEPTRISTRDLLMEWAMEDALEEAQQREGDASGGDENQEEEEYYNEEGEEEGEGEDEEEFEEEEQEEEEEQYPRQLYQKSAQSASQLAAHQEEEEEEQYDEDDVEEEEEEDEDDDYYQDHRQSMRQQWNQLLVANEHPDHADESCLQLLHNLSTKMKTTI